MRTSAAVIVTAAPDTDPVELASAAVRGLLDAAPLDPAAVPLLVLSCADPGGWPDPTGSALLDGEFAAGIVHRVLAANGLVAAVPLGVSLDPGRAEHLAAETAAAILAAERLECAVAVATFVRDDRSVATATALRPAADHEPPRGEHADR
jgi:hypothetical protein